jgi:uncharacterized protein YuzE
MNITYDKVADAVYMQVSSNPVSATMKLDDALIVDRDENGNIVGFEILGASAQGALIKSLENNVVNGVPVAIGEATPTVE